MRAVVRWLVVVGGSMLALAGPAQADTTFVVTKFDDPTPTSCVSGADCSFREAVSAANSAAGADTVQLAAGTYTLTNGQLPTNTTNLTIQGQGASATTIVGADTNSAVSPAGGVIATNGGTLTIRGVTISGNRLTGTMSTGGGAIGAAGGASLVVESSVLRDNRSEAVSNLVGGGAIAGAGGSLTVTSSAIDGNVYAGTTAGTAGAGVGWVNGTAAIAISRSSISRNRADPASGTNVNVAGGLFLNVGIGLSVTDSTVSGNSVSSAAASSARIGGIATNDTPSTLTNVTLTDNVAGAAAGLAVGSLAGVGSGTETVRNTIVAGGVPTNCEVSGAVSSKGNIEDANSCTFFGVGDFRNTDPELGALRDNGGIGRTQAPLDTSPAFGHARPEFCSATDQRGVGRPVGDACDSGAFEGTPPPVNTALPTISGTAAAGQPLTCAPGSFSGAPTIAFQWLRDGAAIPGESAAVHTLTAADLATAIQCQVTATNSAGSVVATSAAVKPAAPAAPAAPSNTARPSLTGTLRTGQKATCAAGTWTGAAGFAFEWLRNGSAIAGANAATYTLTATDAGKALQCRVTATGPGGSAVAESAPAVPAKACIVPTLTGATLATARKRLTKANCAAGKVTKRKSSRKPGLVLSSSPAKGKNLKAGSRVALVLSKAS